VIAGVVSYMLLCWGGGLRDCLVCHLLIFRNVFFSDGSWSASRVLLACKSAWRIWFSMGERTSM